MKLSEQVAIRIEEKTRAYYSDDFKDLMDRMDALERQRQAACKISSELRELADNNEKAVLERSSNSEDGFNYSMPDRHAMFAEARMAREIAKQLEAALGEEPE